MTQVWQIGDRCRAPHDDRELLIIDIIYPDADVDPEAELQPATGKRGPRRWCKLNLLRKVPVDA